MLNNMKDKHGAKHNSKRFGRGIGSGKGKTCGRGGKGQTARTGVAINGFEGGQMPIYMRLPKRGFNNIHAKKYVTMNLDRLQDALDSGKINAKEVLTAQSLKEAGVLAKTEDGLKILGRGEIKAAVKIEVAAITASAKAAIEKAGGNVIVNNKFTAPKSA